jgi:hypothetical protein
MLTERRRHTTADKQRDNEMTDNQEPKKELSGSNLLTQSEQAICRHIAAGDPPNSQRALALLVVNAGSTQSAAAEQAGLSRGQVKYWLSRFRKHRLDVFPSELLEVDLDEIITAPVETLDIREENEVADSGVPEKETGRKKTKKSKKSKKAGNDKRKKQAKKDKKSKNKKKNTKKEKKISGKKKTKKEKKGKKNRKK